MWNKVYSTWIPSDVTVSNGQSMQCLAAANKIKSVFQVKNLKSAECSGSNGDKANFIRTNNKFQEGTNDLTRGLPGRRI